MSPLFALAAALFASGADIVPPAAPAPTLQETPPVVYPQWSGTLALGATWTAGNTETQTVSGSFNTQRRGEDDRWTLDLYSNYGSTTDKATDDKATTTNNSGGTLKYDYFASKKTYLFGSGSGKVDHVADLDLRAILGAGIGYQWKETEKLKWGTELGLSYVDEDFGDNTADADFLAARVGSNLNCQISKSSSFEQVAEILPNFEDSENLLARIDNRLKMSITGKWIAQIQYVLDFDGAVPAGNNQTDHRVVLSVGWNFGS